jgi:hypothetical protein
VVWSVAALDQPAHTEDVAMKAHALAPGLFSWSLYPTQVDLGAVRSALSGAAHPARDGRLTGSPRTGWALTASGKRWAATTTMPLNTDPRAEPERVRLRSSDAWAQWQRRRRVSDRDALAIFRIDEYVPSESREAKIQRIEDLLRHDDEVGAFVRAMAKRARSAL